MLIHNPNSSLQENNKSITLFYRRGVVRLSPSLVERSDTVTAESSPELCPISMNSLNRFVLVTVNWYMSVHYDFICLLKFVLFKINTDTAVHTRDTSFIWKMIYFWIIYKSYWIVYVLFARYHTSFNWYFLRMEMHVKLSINTLSSSFLWYFYC